MSDINKVFLTGRLVADPDIRYTPQGNEVAQFRIAVNMRFKSKQDPNNWQEETSLSQSSPGIGLQAVWKKHSKKATSWLLKDGSV